MEWTFSGYCRSQDQARTVLLEYEQQRWECDCDFPGCAFASSCTIGQQIARTQEDAQ